MNIESVKYTSGGYIVNNRFFIPEDQRNNDYKDIQNWVRLGGVIQPEFTNEELITKAKERKKSEVDNLRDNNLKLPTPQTIVYDGNLSNRTFIVSVRQHLPLFEAIIAKLKRRLESEQNPTRQWTDSDNVRLDLSIADFESLANHLDERDEQEYNQSNLRKKAIDALDSLEEVEAFDINQIL